MWYINRFEFKKRERGGSEGLKSLSFASLWPKQTLPGSRVSEQRRKGGRESLAALKLCLQAFAYQLISHNQQRDQCALAKYLPRLQYGSVQFRSCAPVWFVYTPTSPPQSPITPTRLSLSGLLSNIYKFNAKFVFEVQQIFNIP